MDLVCCDIAGYIVSSLSKVSLSNYNAEMHCLS